MALLTAHGLGKDYGSTVAVAALDLAVEEGEIFGLLGPNGAGKTTAISMLSGVITPSRGSASIAGHDIRKEPFLARQALGLVPQDLALYEEITARQNLAFFGRMYGLTGALLSERVDWALDVAGLTDRADEAVRHFSGGMKRRLNLAAGLLHHPKVLVLDEPTVGVDPQSRNYIFETVRALRSEHRMTVLYTSHYMEEVQALCERVAVMDHGKIIAQGRVADLVAGHSGGLVELVLDGDIDHIKAALAALDGLEGLTLDGERLVAERTLRLAHSGKLSHILAAIEESGAIVRSIHTLEQDLETAFLALTGHRLRDE